jgi:hypothetical protein
VKKHKHIILLVVLLTILVVFEYTAPKPIQWVPSFKNNDKIPYGAFIAFDMLEDAFPRSQIVQNHKTLYQLLSGEDTAKTTLIIITDIFDPGNASIDALLNFAATGNTVFVSATQFDKEFCDSLNFETSTFFSSGVFGDSVANYFFNPGLKSTMPYWIKAAWGNSYFISVDTLRCSAIAGLENGKINFFCMPWGDGFLYIHAEPYAFTNYNLLFKHNAEYMFKTFSYLKNEVIIWDEKNKPGRKANTPLAYILEQDSLRASWYLILVLATVFMIFGAKRHQRAIPEIKPPQNSSLEFAKTLGNLYLSENNHKDIARKKFRYWLDFLREHYYLSFENSEVPDAEKIAEKTGVNVDTIIILRNHIENMPQLNQELLIRFNAALEDFYKNRK